MMGRLAPGTGIVTSWSFIVIYSLVSDLLFGSVFQHRAFSYATFSASSLMTSIVPYGRPVRNCSFTKSWALGRVWPRYQLRTVCEVRFNLLPTCSKLVNPYCLRNWSITVGSNFAVIVAPFELSVPFRFGNFILTHHDRLRKSKFVFYMFMQAIGRFILTHDVLLDTLKACRKHTLSGSSA
nr:MAG TPA: hypothetical protein [Caudoviricetes sp.]